MSTHSHAPHRVGLIPGDGIGPEVSEATVRLLDASGVPVAWQRVEAGAPAERAVHATLAEPGQRTADLGGDAGLDRFTDAVIDPLE